MKVVFVLMFVRYVAPVEYQHGAHVWFERNYDPCPLAVVFDKSYKLQYLMVYDLKESLDPNSGVTQFEILYAGRDGLFLFLEEKKTGNSYSIST